jgi:hypothetical protein
VTRIGSAFSSWRRRRGWPALVAVALIFGACVGWGLRMPRLTAPVFPSKAIDECARGILLSCDALRRFEIEYAAYLRHRKDIIGD